MPQAFAVFLPAAGGFLGLGGSISIGGIALTTATGALTFAGSALNIAGSLLLSAAANALSSGGSQPVPKASNIQQTIRQAVGPRMVHMGRVRTAGTLVFARESVGDLYEVIVFGQDEIDAIEKHYLDKVQVSLDGSGDVTTAQYQYSGASVVRLETRVGLVPETAYSDLTAVFSEWDSAHRLDGLFSGFIRCKGVPAQNFQAIYPNRQPDWEMVVRGVKAFDPRTSTTAWTENAALHIARYIEDPDGFNRPGRVNSARLLTAANDCDDAIPLLAGGTESRYRFGGTYNLSEKPDAVLRRMLDACGGRVSLMPDASFAIDVGKWRIPTVELTASDIIEMVSWTDGPDLLSRYNELPFTYVDHTLDYQQVTGDPWVNDAQQASDGSVLVAGSILDLNLCPSHSQGRRAAKIRQARDNPSEVVVVKCQPSAIVAMYERYITLTDSVILASGYYEILGYSLSLGDMSVTYTLNRVDPSTFDWTTAEEGEPQALPTPSSATSIAAPATFTAAAHGIQVSQNTFAAGIGCAWAAPYASALSPRLEYSPAGAGTWTVIYPDAAATTYEIAPLTDGSAYDVRLAWFSPTGQVGGYNTISGVTASAATSAPAAPADLTVSDLTGGSASVTVTAASSADLWKTEVYRDGVLVATFYSAPGEVSNFTDACGAGTFDWTARSVNVSNVDSASDFGPVTQTIT